MNNNYFLPKCYSNTNMRMMNNQKMKYKSNYLNAKPIKLRKSSDNLFSQNLMKEKSFSRSSLHESSFSSTSSKSSSKSSRSSTSEDNESSNEKNESFDDDDDDVETEAIVQMSNMSFKVKDSPAKTEVDIKYPDKSELHVSWSNVKIREYKTSVSSTSVPTNDSVPIGLSWNIVKEEEYKLDEYEECKERDPYYIDSKNFQRDGYISPNERIQMLNRIGTPRSLIRFTVKNVNSTRKQRVESAVENRRRPNTPTNYTPIRIVPPVMSSAILHKAYNVFK